MALPELAAHMLNVKVVNDYLGTSYGIEEVASWDGLVIDILLALRQGMNPTQKQGEEE